MSSRRNYKELRTGKGALRANKMALEREGFNIGESFNMFKDSQARALPQSQVFKDDIFKYAGDIEEDYNAPGRLGENIRNPSAPPDDFQKIVKLLPKNMWKASALKGRKRMGDTYANKKLTHVGADGRVKYSDKDNDGKVDTGVNAGHPTRAVQLSVDQFSGGRLLQNAEQNYRANIDLFKQPRFEFPNEEGILKLEGGGGDVKRNLPANGNRVGIPPAMGGNGNRLGNRDRGGDEDDDEDDDFGLFPRRIYDPWARRPPDEHNAGNLRVVHNTQPRRGRNPPLNAEMPDSFGNGYTPVSSHTGFGFSGGPTSQSSTSSSFSGTSFGLRPVPSPAAGSQGLDSKRDVMFGELRKDSAKSTKLLSTVVTQLMAVGKAVVGEVRALRGENFVGNKAVVGEVRALRGETIAGNRGVAGELQGVRSDNAKQALIMNKGLQSSLGELATLIKNGSIDTEQENDIFNMVKALTEGADDTKQFANIVKAIRDNSKAVHRLGSKVGASTRQNSKTIRRVQLLRNTVRDLVEVRGALGPAGGRPDTSTAPQTVQRQAIMPGFQPVSKALALIPSRSRSSRASHMAAAGRVFKTRFKRPQILTLKKINNFRTMHNQPLITEFPDSPPMTAAEFEAKNPGSVVLPQDFPAPATQPVHHFGAHGEEREAKTRLTNKNIHEDELKRSRGRQKDSRGALVSARRAQIPASADTAMETARATAVETAARLSKRAQMTTAGKTVSQDGSTRFSTPRVSNAAGAMKKAATIHQDLKDQKQMRADELVGGDERMEDVLRDIWSKKGFFPETARTLRVMNLGISEMRPSLVTEILVQARAENLQEFNRSVLKFGGKQADPHRR